MTTNIIVSLPKSSDQPLHSLRSISVVDAVEHLHQSPVFSVAAHRALAKDSLRLKSSIHD